MITVLFCKISIKQIKITMIQMMDIIVNFENLASGFLFDGIFVRLVGSCG